jgi:translation initiation factor IF-3
LSNFGKTNARVNERIASTRVILINSRGENKGEMSKFDAIGLARQEGFDLVEVSPGKVPVCRIMDYGKHLYNKSKSEKHQKHAPELKEVRFSYMIGDHDIEIKKRKVREFLQAGHKVLVVLVVKGRQKYVAGGSSAKDKFISIVNDFAPSFKANDIKGSDKGYNVILNPVS